MRSLGLVMMLATALSAQEPRPAVAPPPPFPTLVNPNCSHCIDEAKRRKDELKPGEPALCWTRGYSDGGAIPIRFFLSKYRVISDSYGVFVYDPDAGFVRGFAPSYNFVFDGWRHGILALKDTSDGTIFSALSGVGIEGPRKGERLAVVPTIASTWGEAMARNPNAVAYEMHDKYKAVELPAEKNADSVKTRPAKDDPRLRPEDAVLGVRVGAMAKAYPQKDFPRLQTDKIGSTDIVLFGGEGSSTASAYKPVAGQPRKWKGPKPDKNGVSPADAGEPLPDGTALPSRTLTFAEKDGAVIDVETGTTWGIDGRGIRGELKGWTLEWADSVVCNWFAWSAEYPETSVAEAPAPMKGSANDKVKMIAGKSELLRLLPKPFGIVKAVDAKAGTVSLLFDGETVAKVWPVEPDAEVKVKGWWGRLEQLRVGSKVWVWLKLDRNKSPVSVVMIADQASASDIRFDPLAVPKPAPAFVEVPRGLDGEIITKLWDSATQKKWLREKWLAEGLPGMLAFVHHFSGELDLMLDHEAIRWGRSLKPGDAVELSADPPIKAVVKSVQPWRERTQLRLVVGELQANDLKAGARMHLKMTAPPKQVDESPYPPDIGRERTKDERVEWFLASIYCSCRIGKDTCTGMFYTLASCNPNGCGMPNFTRDEIRDLIAKGKSDKEIWDALLADRGPLMLKPHLLP